MHGVKSTLQCMMSYNIPKQLAPLHDHVCGTKEEIVGRRGEPKGTKLGSLAFDQAMQLDSTCAAAYALMATIFSIAGFQEDAEKVDAMRLKYGALHKRGGQGGMVHSFPLHQLLKTSVGVVLEPS